LENIMKQTLAMLGLAGLAGVGWFRSASLPAAPVAKIRVPAFESVDTAEPVNQQDWFTSDFEPPADAKVPAPIAWADSFSPFQTVSASDSEEQPFAVSDSDEPSTTGEVAQSRPDAATRDSAWEDVDTKPQRAKPEERQVLLSGGGRPISMKRIGQGRFRTLIISGLDGRDHSAVQWADDLAEALDDRDDLLRQQEFIIIRAANPDGLAARTRGNAAGVALNRNFPTRRFQMSVADATGTGPASEAETRALLQLLYEIRPHRVVHLTSTGNKSVVYFNQPAANVAERLQRGYGVQKSAINLDQWPGSLEEFVDVTWKAEVVTLQVQGGPELDSKRMPLILSSLTQKEPGPRTLTTSAPASKPGREPARWQSGPNNSPIPANSGTVSSRHQAKSNRGYEELPPPPE
jgi:hypothetical protein